MIKCKLGSQGLVVSEIGLGCMGMDHAYGPSADRHKLDSSPASIREQLEGSLKRLKVDYSF